MVLVLLINAAHLGHPCGIHMAKSGVDHWPLGSPHPKANDSPHASNHTS